VKKYWFVVPPATQECARQEPLVWFEVMRTCPAGQDFDAARAGGGLTIAIAATIITAASSVPRAAIARCHNGDVPIASIRTPSLESRLDTRHDQRTPSTRFNYGTSGDKAVVGDWDDDGIDEVGYWRPSVATFYRQGSSSITFGNPTDIPVIGDWDGDGDDEVGVWRPSEAKFYLRSSSGVTTSFYYGTYGDKPVVGDWDDDGIDEVGIFRPSNATWHLQGVASFVYGNLGDIPLPGDWNGDGRDTVGVVR
jgi:hypothetical protein